jgi:ethanolamine utilization protein EutP
MVNREAIGIITGIDKPDANVERVRRWLQLAGCKKIFPVSSITGEGIAELSAYLEDDEDRERRLKAEAEARKKATTAKKKTTKKATNVKEKV